MVILLTKMSLAKIMNAVYYLCFQLGIYFVIADKTILIIQCVNMLRFFVVIMNTEISHRFPIERVMGNLWEIKAVGG